MTAVPRVVAQGPAGVRAIAAAIRSTGLALHAGPLDRAAYFALASALGSVFHDKSIYVDAAQTYYIRKPDPVPFHTDHVRANVVGWLCEIAEDCANCYLDAARVYAALSAPHRRALAKVECYCPYPRGSTLDPDQPAVITRIVQRRGDVERFFWVPQRAPAGMPRRGPSPFVAEPPDPDIGAALAAYRAGTDVPAEAAHVAVQLARGEAIFVDNNRFLHGRGALPSTSPRQLYRLWINTDRWTSARRHHLTGPAAERD